MEGGKGQLKKEKIDLIVVGDQNSGKTSLIKRFVEGENAFSHFYTPTLGINLQKKEIKINNCLVSVCIWDTAGQQKFLALTKNYFRKADGVLLIFDLTQRASFERISKYWIHEVKDKASEDCTLILVGNKCDLKERAVEFEAAKKIAGDLGLAYFQTSARTGQNVNEAIEYIARECLSKISDSSPSGVQLTKTESSSCFTTPKQFFTRLIGKFKGNNENA